MTRPLLRTISARVEADLAGTDLSVGQRAVMEAALVLTQATAPELTNFLQLKRQFVAKVLKELLEKGHVAQVHNPRHKRSVYFRLTPSGKALIKRVRSVEMAKIDEFAKAFSEEEVETYYRMQCVLNEALSKPS
ncbi:DNA-binding transcriptional repressor MarR [Pseudovibrio axinellae]|uniref:DNA-binding transcriptional repressor MarR n=1 Tax=Pseudovibrio axinellae TaxID=989403 RepID=A0A165YYU8_9HYPH|nr:winged helix DNA-binding protein [Pseudovibrio axinellae]KZL19358.1 DNA-binding transcriptional repressor MarR [Pseudovibrio axinellae]SEQ39848.1 DNA-binding transcriptional regulator, MarR family [Pseudovibrio axinellae]